MGDQARGSGQVAQIARPVIRNIPGEVALANVLLVVGLIIGVVALLRVTNDGVFATIVIVVCGLVWAHALYTSRSSRHRDKQNRSG